MKKDDSKRTLANLVDSFDRDLSTIKKGSTSLEANVEDNYIKPLFACLNWNIHNEGLPHEREEWIVQYQLKRSGGRPDYLLRVWDESISRMRHVLIMEAKHPKFDIARDARWISQAYLYAYSTLSRAERPERRVPLSLLTDFEEFRLFDCRDPEPLKTREDAAPFNKRVIKAFDIKYTDYVDRFDDLWDTFERTNVAQGSLNQWQITDQDLKNARLSPDLAFLATLREWRLELARSMYHNDKTLTEDILTAASQLYVNRIVFLKMLADKGIEEQYLDQLLARVSASKTEDISFHQACADIFESLDRLYNGSIFGHRVELDSVKVDNKVLKSILESIRPEKAIYTLDAMPVNVIGTMYEEFLGEVIRKSGRGIGAEQKPEVRKAGGVYYTPQYIVDYIVEQTVGKILADCEKPEDVSKLRICDPACGSGSFLLGVYDRLLSWHLSWYKRVIDEALDKGQAIAVVQKKYRNAVHLIRLDAEKTNYSLSLTTKLRRDLLTSCVFGVDIDEQAVEVTRFSLSMKAVEDFRDRDELYADVDLFKTTVLPNLDGNIRCGNSLVGEDWFEQQPLSLDDELRERKEVKPFEWKSEFPEVFAKGGFDAVVGNPPYFSVDDTWGKKDPRLAYIKRRYPEVYNDKTDVLFYFFALAIENCSNTIGFIVSRAFLEAFKANKLRGHIATKLDIVEIVDFRNYYVFDGIGITSSIIILRRNKKAPATIRRYIDVDHTPQLDTETNFERTSVQQDQFTEAIWTFSADHVESLIAKIDAGNCPLENILVIGQGMQTGLNSVFGKLQAKDIGSWGLTDGQYFLRARNSDIESWHIADSGEYLLYVEDFTSFKELPLGVQEHLRTHEKDLKARAAYQRGDCEWWRYTWPLHREYYSRAKILSPYMAKKNRFALDTDRRFLGLTDTTVLFDNGQPESMPYLLALLNSRLLTWRFKFMAKLKSGGILEYFWNNISKLPIKRIDLNSRSEKENHDTLANLADKCIKVAESNGIARTESDKKLFSVMAARLDSEIDALVYKLYGLTDEEIAIVEEATN
jgi:type I restriction-modification system DNA methylase subunit